MNIEHLWSTPVMYDVAPFTSDELQELAAFAKEKRKLFDANPVPHNLPDVYMPLKHQFNLLDGSYEKDAPQPVWGKLKFYIDAFYRSYLLNAYGVSNSHEIKYVTRVLPVHYDVENKRTLPHYHHTCDHVMCLYLETGTNRLPVNQRTPGIGDGELILCDPRPMASFPFWEKTRQYDPHPGFCIIHPSRVWHETNAFTSQGDRTLFAVTLRVISHNYTELYVEM